jgi:hypothetical protein
LESHKTHVLTCTCVRTLPIRTQAELPALCTCARPKNAVMGCHGRLLRPSWSVRCAAGRRACHGPGGRGSPFMTSAAPAPRACCRVVPRPVPPSISCHRRAGEARARRERRRGRQLHGRVDPYDVRLVAGGAPARRRAFLVHAARARAGSPLLYLYSTARSSRRTHRTPAATASPCYLLSTPLAALPLAPMKEHG